MRNAAERVSMELIAQRLGVSAMTVSRALKSEIPPQRQDARALFRKIKDVAAEMGYRKSMAPRSMLTGRYDNICVLGSDYWRRNHMPQKRLFAMQEAAAVHGVSLLFNTISDEKLQDDDFIPEMLSNCRSDGLLVNYASGYPKRLEELFAKYRAPAIWLNSKHEADCVYPDDFNGARKAVEHLVSLGHKRIASWSEPKGRQPDEFTWAMHYSKIDRRDGYLTAMREAGLEALEMINPSPMNYDDYEKFLRPWLERPDRPTAIIAYAPPEATAVVQCAMKLGLRIPDDLSLISFHDSPDIFQFTTMLLPEELLGSLAVELLMRKIADPAQRLEPKALEVELYNPSLTCAPAPRDAKTGKASGKGKAVR